MKDQGGANQAEGDARGNERNQHRPDLSALQVGTGRPDGAAGVAMPFSL